MHRTKVLYEYDLHVEIASCEMADAQTLRSAVSSRGLDDILAYACSLHASTDFREKLYKVFQSALKLPGAGPNARKAAATLSQSRGIFKLLKCVNNIETYRKALSEDDAVLRGLHKTEACLNSLVGVMQDAISLDKLFSTKLVSERFAWCIASWCLPSCDQTTHALRCVSAGLCARQRDSMSSARSSRPSAVLGWPRRRW